MADVRPIKKGTSTQFAEMGGTDTIPASLIGIVPKFEVPSGLVNGSNTVFTLSATPVANASVIMVLDGVTQTNGTDYTVSGTTVTFTTAPASGTELVAIYNSAASAGGGDFSSNTSSAVDGEVVLFSGTGGKTGKRATGTGIAKVTSGVLSALSAAQATTELNDFVGDSGSGGTKGLVPAPSGGDSGKYLKGDGTWGTVAGGGGSPSVITPPQITSDQDDYAPTGWAAATHVRISGDNGIRAITGFSSSTISDGHEKTITNIGSYPIYFPGDHPDSSSGNRIDSEMDFIFYPKTAIKIVYDSTSSKWVVSGGIFSYRKMVFFQWAFSSTTAGDHYQITYLALSSGSASYGITPTAGFPYSSSLSTLTTTTGGAAIHMAKSNAGQFMTFSDGHISVDFLFFIPTISDGTNTFTTAFQITNAPNSTSITPNNTVGLRYSSGINSGKFEIFTKNNAGSESVADSGITVAANTLYYVRIELDKSKSDFRAYIDGVFVGNVTGTMPNNVVCGTRAVILKSAGSSARTLNMCAMSTRVIYP